MPKVNNLINKIDFRELRRINLDKLQYLLYTENEVIKSAAYIILDYITVCEFQILYR